MWSRSQVSSSWKPVTPSPRKDELYDPSSADFFPHGLETQGLVVEFQAALKVQHVEIRSGKKVKRIIIASKPQDNAVFTFWQLKSWGDRLSRALA